MTRGPGRRRRDADDNAIIQLLKREDEMFAFIRQDMVIPEEWAVVSMNTLPATIKISRFDTDETTTHPAGKKKDKFIIVT